ncbi:MAG TPA: hypothetical protein VHF89_16375 [Solirubrobacteraceae bacterium]|nr:hypothetical protein [Solirubrobacteraceae bacterium]
MSRAPNVRLRYVLPVVVLLAALCAPAAYAVDDFRNWNHPYGKKQKCYKLKNGTSTAATDRMSRYADFSVVDPDLSNGYLFPNNTTLTGDSTDLCTSNTGVVRLDLTEKLTVANQGTLYFHKGGQGYTPDSSPYGHIRNTDLANTAPTFPATSTEPAGPLSKSRLDTYGADPLINNRGAGRKCSDTPYSGGTTQFQVTSAMGPPAHWFYKPSEPDGAGYRKYANAGRTTNGDKSRDFQYLQWSWVGKYLWNNTTRTEFTTGTGYGAVRTILPPGTPVTRCDVAAITSRAYQQNDIVPVGRVTAIYVRVTVGGNELYGWLMHSWAPLRPGGNGTVDSDYGPTYCVLAPTSNLGCAQQPPPDRVGCCLGPDQTLNYDQYLISDNGAYRLVMQRDGNLVEYGPSGPVWASNTYSPGARAVMQLDGNLVIYAWNGGPIWSTNTWWGGRSTLVVQNDGNLVIYGPNGPTWARW